VVILALLVALSTVQVPAEAPAASTPAETTPPPVLREVVLEGVSYFNRDQVLKAIRLQPGGRFRRDPAEVAASLRAHYEGQCFFAVRVAARFDPEAGLLTLTVDEGRMHRLVLDGLEGDEEARLRAVLGIEPGTLLRDKEVRDAMGRLEAATGGAYRIEGGPPWTVEEGPEGPTLRLRLARRRFRARPLLSGPDNSPYRTRVEGRAPGLGVDVTLFGGASANHTSIYLRGAYAFEAEVWRYAAGIRRPFGPDHLVTVGYERHDMTDTDDLFRRRPVAGPRSRPIVFHITDEYFRRRGDEAYLFLRLTPRAHLGVSFRNDTHDSLPVIDDDAILFFTRSPRPNPEVGEGQMRSLLFTARWAQHEALFPKWEYEQDSFLLRTTYGTPFEHAQGARVEGTYEIADEELGSDFSFHRFTGQARASRSVGTRHTVTGRLLAGLTRGAPPLQRRFALGGLGTLRGYALKEFAGEQAALASVEWMVATRPRFPALVLFYDGGVAWTEGTSGAGWKSDAGAGLQWSILGRGQVRLDLAVPFQPAPGNDRARFYANLRLPF
jgi:Omp85 superfamily domain